MLAGETEMIPRRKKSSIHIDPQKQKARHPGQGQMGKSQDALGGIRRSQIWRVACIVISMERGAKQGK